MDNPDFLAYLREESERSLDGALLQDVEAAIRSYNCEPYGDEEDGRSQVVAADVAETIDWMAPSIARTLFSTDRIAELEADSPDQADVVEQANEKLHDDMRRKHYALVRDFIKAGLLERIGVIKTCVESKRKRVEYIVPDLFIPEQAIAAEPVGAIDEQGNELWRVAIVEEQTEFTDYNVSLEEFRFSPDARDFEKAPYLAHVTERTLSDLAEMGYEDLDRLASEAPEYDGSFRDLNGRNSWMQDRSGVMRKVWLHEEYVFFDMDGDGIAERLKVHRVGNEILSAEPIDYQPFEYWTPFPMPGRLVGQSLADKVVDIQRKSTIIERNALDSVYAQVAPGHYVQEEFIGDNTIDDLLTVRPNRIIRTKRGLPQPETRNDVSAICFSALEQIRNQRERRTGISNLHMGLDGDTLNDTATGAALMHSAGQLIQEALAREVAEAVARWFLRKYKLMREYGQPFRLKIDDQFQDVDPTQWPEIVDIKVRVGLGSGSKDERLIHRRELGAYQAQLKEVGSPLVSDEHIYNNLAGLTRDMGFNPSELFGDPKMQPEQAEQPDPAQMEAQAKIERDNAVVMAKMEADAAERERRMIETVSKIELEQVKAQAKDELERMKAANQAALAEQKTMFEQRLAAFKASAEMQRKVDLSENRPGGRLDA